MRFHRGYISLVVLSVTVCSATHPCFGQYGTRSEPQVSDSVATPIKAVGLPQSLNKDQVFMDEFDLSASPVADQIERVKSFNGCLLPRQSLIIHFTRWGVNGGSAPYQLVSSEWKAYQASRRNGACHFRKVQVRTDDQGNDYPLLYGVESAAFVGISTFAQLDDYGELPSGARSVPVVASIVYKISVTKTTPENVQNFGMLVAALLGATTGGAGEKAKGYPTYIATSLISGYKRLPFNFNFGYSLTPPAQSATAAESPGVPTPSESVPVPKAYVGVAYSEALPFEDGVGRKTFQVLRENQPPAGLEVESVGMLSGKAKGPGISTFIVDVTDSDEPPKTVRMRYQITVAPQSERPTNLAGGAPAKPPSTAKPSGPGPSSPSDNSNQQNADVIDCTGVSDKTPCTFQKSLKSDDREPFDFSLAVPIPGVRETQYTISGNTAKPSVTTHVDLYAMVDLYPAFLWKDKRSWAPHFGVGLPVAGKPFYRPYFGAAENFTNWTGLRRHGFPLEMSVFAGVVYMRVQNPMTVSNPGPGQPSVVLKPTRVVKPIFGVELPVGSLISKVGGSGKSKSSQSQSGKQ